MPLQYILQIYRTLIDSPFLTISQRNGHLLETIFENMMNIIPIDIIIFSENNFDIIRKDMRWRKDTACWTYQWF